MATGRRHRRRRRCSSTRMAARPRRAGKRRRSAHSKSGRNAASNSECSKPHGVEALPKCGCRDRVPALPAAVRARLRARPLAGPHQQVELAALDLLLEQPESRLLRRRRAPRPARRTRGGCPRADLRLELPERLQLLAQRDLVDWRRLEQRAHRVDELPARLLVPPPCRLQRLQRRERARELRVGQAAACPGPAAARRNRTSARVRPASGPARSPQRPVAPPRRAGSWACAAARRQRPRRPARPTPTSNRIALHG